MQLLAGTWIRAGQPVLAFIDTSEQIISVQIAQNYLRHVKAGQNAEIVFRLYPGKTFPAKVVNIVRATPEGCGFRGKKPIGSSATCPAITIEKAHPIRGNMASLL